MRTRPSVWPKACRFWPSARRANRSTYLTWTDNSGNETGFLIQRADNVLFSLGVVNATVGPNITTFSQTVTPGRTYYYRVLAFTSTIQSGWSNTAGVTARD